MNNSKSLIGRRAYMNSTIVNFSGDLFAKGLPDDPHRIRKLAMRYKDIDDSVSNVLEKVNPNKKTMWGHLDSTVKDAGAGLGLGITMAGAGLRNNERTQGLGTALKRHGANVLLNENMQRAYGLGVPIGVAGIGTVSGLAAADSALKEIKEKEYE